VLKLSRQTKTKFQQICSAEGMILAGCLVLLEKMEAKKQ